ncbi:MAG TPA: IPT/TIG domain-containing protein, partial [Niabella sp.]|nr:IPT/TIG domain-containing protein [Niabella sp.]
MKKKLNYLIFLLAFFTATPFFISSCGDKEVDDKNVAGLRPTITSLSPESGKPGDLLTITGTGFGTDKTKVRVRFNTTDATNIISVTDTKIEVEAPAGFSDQTVSVPVFISDVASNSKTFYYVDSKPPSITSVTATCFYGSTVVIAGNNFSANIEDNIVKFGDVTATVTKATKTSLTVTAPDLGTATSAGITVTRTGIVSNAKTIAVDADQNKVATFNWSTQNIRAGIVYKVGEFSLFGSVIRKIHVLDITLNESNTLGIGVAQTTAVPPHKATSLICNDDYNAIAGINGGYFPMDGASYKDPYIRINGATMQLGDDEDIPRLYTNSALLINNNVATIRKFTENHERLNQVAAAIPVAEAQHIIVSGPMLITNGVLESLSNALHNTSSTG